MFNKIIDLIHSDPRKGIIIETGLGVPLQTLLYSRDGASNTILYGISPYSKESQKSKLGDLPRSVCAETAKALTFGDWLPLGLVPDFVIASTGAAVTEVSAHFWTCFRSFNNLKLLHAYLPIKINFSRDHLIEEVGKLNLLFLALNLGILSKQEFLYNAELSLLKIDIIENLSITDILTELEPNRGQQVYGYHKGKFVRVLDLLRKHKKIYRGSFNPPTNSHTIIGKDCLWEITLNHRFKTPSVKQVLHVLNMLDLLEIPVLISNIQYFRAFDNFIKFNYGIDPIYVVGYDIYEKICQDGGADDLKFEIHAPKDEIRATQARAGDLSIVDPKIKQYIIEHSLYDLKI